MSFFIFSNAYAKNSNRNSNILDPKSSQNLRARSTCPQRLPSNPGLCIYPLIAGFIRLRRLEVAIVCPSHSRRGNLDAFLFQRTDRSSGAKRNLKTRANYTWNFLRIHCPTILIFLFPSSTNRIEQIINLLNNKN